MKPAVTERVAGFWPLALAVAVLAASAQPCQSAPGDSCAWGVRPMLAISLSDPLALDALQCALNLSLEQRSLIADLAAREKKKCSEWIEQAEAILSSTTMTIKVKDRETRRLAAKQVRRGRLKAFDGKLRDSLAPGQMVLLLVWLDEQWALLLGKSVEPAFGARELVDALGQAIGSPDANLERIREAWTYYKTIELTLRKKLLSNPEGDPMYETQYLRMARKQADATAKAVLDESKRAKYVEFLGQHQ